MAEFVVKAPLVCVKDEAGAVQYVYRGAPVPPYVKGEALEQLLETGMVEQIGEPEAAAPVKEMAAGDDPADFSVAQVQAFLAGADDEEKTRVVEAEKAGKNRSTLVS